jgi:hypothetical protein
LLDFNASATLIAPSAPILFEDKLIGVEFKYKTIQSNQSKKQDITTLTQG